ncbi:ADP-ribosylglycohydrolase family protein [Gordonia sp. SMJS1]|uniref:ADP-ribosylglycohydrolase family protein n=1 Tax=Gordonia sp. SMJS1 TaxID=3039400 RepID=UPI0032AF0883
MPSTPTTHRVERDRTLHQEERYAPHHRATRPRAGVVLGTAAGDGLGVPYKFESRVLRGDEAPQLLGGGLDYFAPGEWSDDTSMAMAIADVAATGADLTSDEALDAIADNLGVGSFHVTRSVR